MTHLPTVGRLVYTKILTANDVGKTGSHQVGIHIPMSDIKAFPRLDASRYNPRVWLTIVDPDGELCEWRFIYFNGKLHQRSTRSEYRLTSTGPFLRKWSGSSGKTLHMTRIGQVVYEVKIV